MASLTRRSLVLLAALAFVGGCTEPLEITPPGTYDATTYSAGPSEVDRIDLLKRGITWTLTIREDRSVIDQWDVVGPNNLVSHTTVSVTAHREGNTITFINANPSDRILTERTWTLDGDQITAVNQTVDGVNAVIRFTRR
jgi:hypothetical protein